MATTYGMTPMMSTTMPNPTGMSSTPTMSQAQSMGFTRNMNLPLSNARPIQVDENTPNLEEIQNFPLAGRGMDGTHFHQDPVTGQIYRMTDEFHDRIPEILASRRSTQMVGVMSSGIMTTMTGTMNTQTSAPYSAGNAVISVTPISENNGLIPLNTISDYVNIIDNINPISTTRTQTIQVYPSNFGYTETSNIFLQNQTIIQTESQRTYQQAMSQFKTPINKFVNSSTMGQTSVLFSKYLPANRFLNSLNLSYYGSYSSNQFTPINRFINSR